LRLHVPRPLQSLAARIGVFVFAATLISALAVAGTSAYALRAFLRGLSNRVLELGGESGADTQPHAYPGSYVEYVARTGHEAPGVHR
jgi:hypothetical protein